MHYTFILPFLFPEPKNQLTTYHFIFCLKIWFMHYAFILPFLFPEPKNQLTTYRFIFYLIIILDLKNNSKPFTLAQSNTLLFTHCSFISYSLSSI